MNHLIRAELRRLFTTSLWKWGPVAAVLCGGGLVAMATLVGPENFEPPLPGIDTSTGTRLVLSMVGLTALIPGLFGATAVTTEYRHRTITYTFLFEPNRYRVLTAKLLAYAMAGASYGALTSLSAAAALYGGAAARGVTVAASATTVTTILCGLTAAMTVYTVLGVGVGALLRNQTATMLILGGYLYMVENLLAVIPGFQLIYPFLPGGATAALTGSALMSEAAEQTGSAVSLLPPVFGAMVLLAYALAASTAAVVVPLHRDIT
jgi:ABC-2 type transport system permease protein